MMGNCFGESIIKNSEVDIDFHFVIWLLYHNIIEIPFRIFNFPDEFGLFQFIHFGCDSVLKVRCYFSCFLLNRFDQGLHATPI